MKKILFLLTLVLSIVSISACQTVYECAPAEEWSYDETNHWHACFIAKCDEQYDLAEHTFGEWEVVDETVKSRSCKVCGYVEEAEIEGGEHVHAPSNEWSSNEINHWHTCDGCTELLDKAAHDWDEGEVTTKPTEQAAGVKTYTCETCGKTKEEEVPKLSHTHTPSSAWASDETNHWHTCGGCSELLDKAAHNWDAGVETTPATETEKGVMTFTCETCGKTKTQDIPELNHTHTPNADWTSDDENHWHTCGGCSLLLDKAAHDWDAGQVTSDPTEDAVGVKTYTCETCGKTKEEEVPKLEHTHVYDSELKGDVTGHWIECKCGEKEEVLDHSYGVWTDKTDTQERTCSECGYVDSRSLTDTWDGSSVSASLLGSGTETDPYQIHSAADLAYFKDNAANISHVKLMRNIDLAQSVFMIPSFNGTFDGNKYSITVNFTDWSDNGVALFKVVEASGIVKNLTLKGSIVGWTKTAGFAGLLNGSILDCFNYVNVESKWTSGGFAAITNGTITNCENHGNLSNGHGENGGIAGVSNGSIINCKNYGTISCPGSSDGQSWGVGGIAGKANAAITDCNNYGAVSGHGQIGGIVGLANCNITNCNNLVDQNVSLSGNVSGTVEQVGGIVGCLDGGSISNCNNSGKISGICRTGGIVGNIPYIEGVAQRTVSNCKNTGEISATTWGNGGIAGTIDIVYMSDCTNEGKVNSGDCAGGIASAVYGSATLEKCDNYGEICGWTNLGGITDFNDGTIKNCDNYGVLTPNPENSESVISSLVARNNGTVDSDCEDKRSVN